MSSKTKPTDGARSALVSFAPAFDGFHEGGDPGDLDAFTREALALLDYAPAFTLYGEPTRDSFGDLHRRKNEVSRPSIRLFTDKMEPPFRPGVSTPFEEGDRYYVERVGPLVCAGVYACLLPRARTLDLCRIDPRPAGTWRISYGNPAYEGRTERPLNRNTVPFLRLTDDCYYEVEKWVRAARKQGLIPTWTEG